MKSILNDAHEQIRNLHEQQENAMQSIDHSKTQELERATAEIQRLRSHLLEAEHAHNDELLAFSTQVEEKEAQLNEALTRAQDLEATLREQTMDDGVITQLRQEQQSMTIELDNSREECQQLRLQLDNLQAVLDGYELGKPDPKNLYFGIPQAIYLNYMRFDLVLLLYHRL